MWVFFVVLGLNGLYRESEFVILIDWYVSLFKYRIFFIKNLDIILDIIYSKWKIL